MEKRKISHTDIEVSALGLGTWAFGGGIWWGPQEDRDSVETLEKALASGIGLIDTAPVYGLGRSENIIGAFLQKRGLRQKTVLATKLGLSWQGRKIFHDLSPEKMKQELDGSRKRLRTDVLDIYQVHWPDPQRPLARAAETMCSFYDKKKIRAVGVSNFSLDQIKEFRKYSPLHTVQPAYNMFNREIEKELIPFCQDHNISILAYTPLHSGILTGKFFRANAKIPDDLCRRNKPDLKAPFYDITKEAVSDLEKIAVSCGCSLTQLVLNWTAAQKGITSVLAGARRKEQVRENAAGFDFKIKESDLEKVDEILEKRSQQIKFVKDDEHR